MSKARPSNSKKSKSVNKFQSQINSLEQLVNNPPLSITKQWLKERNEQQKKLFDEITQSECSGKTQSLHQLVTLGKKIKEMRKKYKSSINNLKTPISKGSRKSSKSKKSVSKKGQSRLSLSRSYARSPDQSRSKSSKKKKQQSQVVTKYKTQNTPKFKKKQFENKLGSFSKDVVEKQKESERNNARIIASRVSKGTRKSSNKKSSHGRSESISRSRSIASSSKKYSYKKRAYSPEADESSSITLSSDLKEAVNLRMNNQKSHVKSKYELFVDNEKRSQELNAGQLSREENLMLTTKLESITKEKLLREYRILFYRSKEIRKLLTEYYEQNLNLNDEIDNLKIEIEDKSSEIKQYRKELKTQSKEMKQLHQEYTTKIDSLGKSFQNQELNSIPINEYEHLKLENEKIVIENEMLKEDYKILTQKLQQIENDIFQKRQYEIPEQELSQRIQRELDTLRDQYEKIREENLRLKLSLDKENLTNRELSQQIYQKKNEHDNTVEQKQYEATSLKAQLQNGNTKIQKLEQQISQMKFQMITDQESNFTIKDKIVRQEEELRIANLKVENREKEINEFRTKELVLKKKILELESKVELQYQQNQNSFETNITMNKNNNNSIEQLLNKELSAERQFLAKTQEQLLNLQKDYDQLQREYKSIQLELQFEQNQSNSLKQRLQQLQEEHDINIQRLQKQFNDNESNRQKELISTEQQAKNQENMLYSAQQRISELETEIRLFNKQEIDYKNEINEIRLQIDKYQLKLEQNENKLQDFSKQIYDLQSENTEINETNKQLRIQTQQLKKELESIDKIKDNYKNKYLNNRYENKKLLNQYNEKENIMKQTYTSELERIRSEKEQLERMKSQEDVNRNQRDKKLKVINDLQYMIKEHKKAIEK